MVDFSLTSPFNEFLYTAAVEEKIILFNPYFIHVSKKILDFSKLFTRYFFGLKTDSSTLLKAAR